VHINRVERAELKSISFVQGILSLALALDAEEKGNYYEWEIAEAISRGLMLKERPVIEDLKRNTRRGKNNCGDFQTGDRV